MIPQAYGLAYLYHHQDRILNNPTVNTAPFINANQAAIAVSLWCRAFETVRKLQQDMGYASYGLSSFSTSDYLWGTTTSRSRASHGGVSKELPAPKRSLSEGEVQLRPVRSDDRISVIAGNGMDATSARSRDGIEVSQDFEWSVEGNHEDG